MILISMDDSSQNRLPGHGGDKCQFDGINLEFQKMVNGEPSGNRRYFPDLQTNSGKKVFDTVGDYILLNVQDSIADFAGMVTDEPMTIGLDGEIKKACQGGTGLKKYRVKSRDDFGDVEDDDPINTLKIDQSFVRDMHKNESSLELVRSIVSLGKNLKMAIVAEGVEQIEEARLLKDMGCEYAQGYYFAKPMSEEDVIPLVSDWQNPEI